MANNRLDLLGRGWAFPFRFTGAGRVQKLIGVQMADGVEKVKMAIQQILGTRVGSRVIDRNFGSNTKGIIFEPIGSLTASRLRYAIMEAIQLWEKRVEILSIDVDMTQYKEGVLQAHIEFRIISTQVIGNMVYPFYISPDMQATVVRVGSFGA